MTYLKKALKEGDIYQNPVPTKMKVPFLKLIGKMINGKEERVPKVAPGPFHTDLSVYNTPPVSGLRVTWIGHSSLLIEIDGKRILTDPVWGDRASFVSFAGPKRFFAPPFPLEQLPVLDAIILSHDHYDHLDKPSIKRLVGLSTPIYCSLGVGKHLIKWGIAASRITEMDWTDKVMVGADLSITALPARHFSGRGLRRNRTLWSSFVIKGHTHNIFFGADSGWFPGFKDIGDVYGPFDLTMLEIGAYHEYWANIHMGPERASEAQVALGSKLLLPIHWGTFNLALHAWTEPVERIIEYAKQKNFQLVLPTPGQPTEINGAAHNSEWWKK